MEYALAAEVVAKLLVIRNIVNVREKHETYAAQLFELAHQGLGKTRRVDQNISRIAPDEITMRTETVGRGEATVVDIIIKGLR